MDKTEVYFVLLRRMNVKDIFPVQPHTLHNIAPDIQVLDILTFGSPAAFDAALLCRAPNNAAMAHLLGQLDGWHTDIALATSHVRFAPAGRGRPQVI